MCGIFGYAGPEARPELLVEGIKRLEYRGYDSWGLCLASRDHLSLVRRVGRIGGVEAAGLVMDGSAPAAA
jgi:glucosamine--fructose-6-phosphate aminotransferase (isomerizing)